MRTMCAALLALGLGVAVLGCKKRAEPAPDAPGADPKPPGPTASGKSIITIGKTTTFVTGPKDADGRIDYAAALNERMSKSVTAENNANVALWKVLGPNPASGKVPPGFFKMMGTTEPPATGDYFVGLRQHAQQQPAGGTPEAAFDAMKRYSDRPWAVNDSPTLAAWLQANQKPLAAVIEATKRPQYYNPLIPEQTAKGSKGLMSVLLPGVQADREIASALACRAMLSVGQNQPAAAWQDLLACHRLARLVGRGGTLIEGLVGMAIEQIACRADIAFLDRVKPDAKSIEQCLRDLRALPALPGVAEKIDGAERFTLLETIMLLDKYGVALITNLADGADGGAPAFGDDVLAGIDWNPALEAANKMYDRLVAAVREKNRAKRNLALTEIENDLNKMRSSLMGGAAALTLKNPALPPATRGADVGTVLVTLLAPAVRKVQDASDRATQTHENVITAFACSWYQRFNGKYPDKLQDLVPTYLSAVPTDLFSDKPLLYLGGVNGCSFHSVGPNGIDESGDSTPPRDDIGITLPLRRK